MSSSGEIQELENCFLDFFFLSKTKEKAEKSSVKGRELVRLVDIPNLVQVSKVFIWVSLIVVNYCVFLFLFYNLYFYTLHGSVCSIQLSIWAVFYWTDVVMIPLICYNYDDDLSVRFFPFSWFLFSFFSLDYRFINTRPPKELGRRVQNWRPQTLMTCS